jgi:hypothetical protein
MRIEEFINKVASEPERTFMRTICITPPEVFTKMVKSGMTVKAIQSAPESRKERKEYHYRHILGASASPDVIDTWQRQHPSHPLPADLRALVARINGIHLWANPETGRSYIGLAPIEEWEVARIKFFGPTADPSLLDDHYVALSYHQNRDDYIVLDVTSGEYSAMDIYGSGPTISVGNTAEELLDWIWQDRITPEASPPEE